MVDAVDTFEGNPQGQVNLRKKNQGLQINLQALAGTKNRSPNSSGEAPLV